MRERITSKTNPLVQRIKKLRTSRSYRYQERQFVADGVKLVAEALRWRVELCTVVVQDGVKADFLPDHVPTVTVTESLMRDISRMDTPQGVLAVCKMPEQPALTVCPGCLILDEIQDPGNLGTILRTADALQVPVILSEGCVDPYGEKTVRATMGAVFRTPPMQAKRAEIVAACCKAYVPLCATAFSDRAKDIRSLKMEDYAVVIGSEGKGVCADFLLAAEAEAVIPMNARCESLNAAVAATIVMWQMKR